MRMNKMVATRRSKSTSNCALPSLIQSSTPVESPSSTEVECVSDDTSRPPSLRSQHRSTAKCYSLELGASWSRSGSELCRISTRNRRSKTARDATMRNKSTFVPRGRTDPAPRRNTPLSAPVPTATPRGNFRRFGPSSSGGPWTATISPSFVVPFHC